MLGSAYLVGWSGPYYVSGNFKSSLAQHSEWAKVRGFPLIRTKGTIIPLTAFWQPLHAIELS